MTALLKVVHMHPKTPISFVKKVELTNALKEITEFHHSVTEVGNCHLIGGAAAAAQCTRVLADGEITSLLGDSTEFNAELLDAVYVHGMVPAEDALSSTVITKHTVMKLGYNVELSPVTEEVLGRVFAVLREVFTDVCFQETVVVHQLNKHTWMGAEVHQLHFDIPMNHVGGLLTVTFCAVPKS